MPPLLVNAVRVSNGHFTYKDTQTGKAYHIVLDNFVTGAKDLDNPSDINFKGHYNEKSFEGSGTMGPMFALMDPEKAWPIKLTFETEGVVATIDGSIRDIMKRSGLNLTVSVEGDSIREITKMAGIEIKDLPELGPFKFVANIADANGKPTIAKFDLRLGEKEKVEVNASGGIKDPLSQRGIDIQFLIQGKNTAFLEDLSETSLPFEGAFKLSGRVSDPAARIYQVSALDLEMGENVLEGALKIALDAEPPRFSGTLTAKKIDLRSLSPKKEKPAEEPEKSRVSDKNKEKVFSNDPLPLDVLKKIDGNLKLEVSQLFLPQLAVTDLSANLTIENGLLIVKPIKSAIGGGTLNADFSISTRGNNGVFSTAIDIDQMDIAAMIEQLKLKEKLEGDLRAEISLDGTGNSVAAIMGSLNGKVLVVVGKGRLDNKYLKLLGADFTSEALRLLNPFDEEEEYTELNCLVGAFGIEDGLATSKALVCDTNYISLISGGTIDLKTEELSLSIKPSPKKGVGVSGIGKLSISLSELAKPLKMGGTLAHPSIGLDPTQTALSLGKVAGGTLLFGPIGIAAALLSGQLGDENPCLAAIEASETGVGSPSESTQKEKEKAPEAAGEEEQGTIENIGESIKKLFGD